MGTLWDITYNAKRIVGKMEETKMADIIPTKPKTIGKVLVLGTGVVWSTPVVSGLLSGIKMLATEVPVVGMSIATVLAAGVSASVIQYLIETYWK